LFFLSGWEGSHCIVRSGYGSILQHLANDLNVLLNRTCLEIDYSTSNSDPCKVRVFNSETNQEEIFTADFVVCTVSLGVLKANSIVFSPPLPDWKQSSIKSLGFGLLNKLVLEFPSRFWNDLDMFGALRETCELRGRFYQFWNLYPNTNKPILVALATGESAFEVEKIRLNELVYDCMNILRRIFGSSIPSPIISHQTQWYEDKFARGSYSYIAVGSSGADYDVLARPVNDKLFFAGEATNRHYPATVPGAIISGLRAAGKILELIQPPVSLENLGDDFLAEQAIQAAQLKAKLENLHQDEEEVDDSELSVEEAERRAKRAEFLTNFDHQLSMEWYRNRQKKRRGIRSEHHQLINVRREEEEEESRWRAEHGFTKRDSQEIQLKLQQQRDALLVGKLHSAKEPEKNQEEKVPVVNNLPVGLVLYQGELENRFAAAAPKADDLPLVKSFQEFDADLALNNQDNNQPDQQAKSNKRRSHSSADHSSHSKRDGDSKRHKSHRSHSIEQIPDEKVRSLLYRFISQQFCTLFPSVEVSLPPVHSMLKSATQIVFDDWKSKPRVGISFDSWMSDKRKESIDALIRKYWEKSKGKVENLETNNNQQK
jgi:hypothetical protein